MRLEDHFVHVRELLRDSDRQNPHLNFCTIQLAGPCCNSLNHALRKQGSHVMSLVPDGQPVLDADSVSQLLVPDGQPVLIIILNQQMVNGFINQLSGLQ